MKQKENKNLKQGFTLLELLVVVLIIGILAAIALPQYKRAVERSKNAQALAILKSLDTAIQDYYLVNSTWPTSFDELSVAAPDWTGTTLWTHSSSDITDVRSNEEWSLQLVKASRRVELQIGRITGKYAGNGFSIEYIHPYDKTEIPLNTILCITKGVREVDFCTKIMNGERVSNYALKGAGYFYKFN